MDANADSQSLYIACAQEGTTAQVDAFEVLWAQLYGLARRILRDQPDGEALAADCAQQALIKIHRNLAQCRNPAAFREWAAQALRRQVIDELRRPSLARRASLPDDDDHHAWLAAPQTQPGDDLRATILEALRSGPLSERSRRVIVGRYFEEQPDEALARAESQREGQQLLPSHIQVTRSKNLAALRRDTALLARLRELMEP